MNIASVLLKLIVSEVMSRERLSDTPSVRGTEDTNDNNTIDNNIISVIVDFIVSLKAHYITHEYLFFAIFVPGN